MATKRTPQQQTYYNAELARERQGWSAAAGQVSQQQKNYDAEIARERQGFADAYSALHPTWVPDAADNVTLSHPIHPVVFDPLLDPAYAAGSSAVTNATQHAEPSTATPTIRASIPAIRHTTSRSRRATTRTAV
jgi:hypothetical protein